MAAFVHSQNLESGISAQSRQTNQIKCPMAHRVGSWPTTAQKYGRYSCTITSRLVFMLHSNSLEPRWYYARSAPWRRGSLNFHRLPRSSILSVIFISLSILKPSPWPVVLGCCACCSGCWMFSCPYWPFTAVGSTTKTPSGTAVESSGAESVMLSAGYGSNEKLQKCRTWVRRAASRLGRVPVRGAVRETPRAAAGPVAPLTQRKAKQRR